MQKIDFNNWERKEHFEFFQEFEDPFYNICAEVDVTQLIEICRIKNLNYFISSLYLSQMAVNSIDELKFRIVNGEVFKFENIDIGTTLLNDDKTFGFSYFDYSGSFSLFYEKAYQKYKQRDKKTSLKPNPYGEAVVYYSVVPWISFSSISHAKNNKKGDSIPRIVFGKYSKKGEKILMPVSIEVNHSLADGYHIGKYFEKFESLCLKAESNLK